MNAVELSNAAEIAYLKLELAEETAKHKLTISQLDWGMEQIADLKRQLAEAEGTEGRLREALKDAIACVEEWSGYASGYFKDKHDLSGDLERLRAALSGKDAANG